MKKDNGKQKKQRIKGKAFWGIMTGIFAVLFTVTMAGGQIANNYSSILNLVLKTETTKTVGDPGKMYYEADFANSTEQAANAEKLVTKVSESGSVLLKNDNEALPLSQGAKVSLFCKSSVDFVYGGRGSGGMNSDSAATLREALEEDGFSVNPVLWDFYETGAGKDYGRIAAQGAMNNFVFDNAGFLTNEVPLSVYSDKEWNSVSEYGDAAIVVLSRVCGEGPDLPWYGAGDGDGNILSLSGEERDLLKKVSELKQSGSIKKIVVLLNTSNAIELDFLNPEICGVDYGIDSCMWVGQVGQSGIEAIGDLLNGNVNPSGKLVDTYCYDNLTSPAIQNAHAATYMNAQAEGLDFKTGYNQYYVAYQEGIYVGYRYYETRYEDMVLGNDNVGEYDYSATVAYPFGYGLSYTTFEYGKLNMTQADDVFTFTVDVTNTGNVDGSEVVEIFMQSPYTDYDRTYGIEKAAVELVGFEKASIKAGETETITVTVSKDELRSYDADEAKTYIIDAGNYYFAAGNGAHDALNNILAMKLSLNDISNGQVDMTKMTGEGNIAYAAAYVQEEADLTGFSTAKTGSKITNQLEHADLNKTDEDTSNDIVYLSRNDWAGTMPQAKITETSYEAAVQLSANEQMVKELKSRYSSIGSGEMPVMGKEGTLNLAQFVGVPLDGSINVEGNEYTWDDLLDQLTFGEMAKMVGQGYHSTVFVPSINKPATKDENGPQGITATLTGGDSSTAYTSADLLAAAYDKELAKEVGISMGNDCLLVSGKAYSGLYGPGVNIHRTPYSGRNFEYYSEDPFISGKICSAQVTGIQEKGVYVYLKHFALNDQETARDGISVWTNEQAAREIYLQAFEYPITEGGAYCVMTSFNRLGTVWTGADYNLLTNILRNEWNMPGMALTDFSNSNNYMDVLQGVVAGSDCWDCNDASKWTASLQENKDDPAIAAALRTASERILYTVANSNAMNNVSANQKIVEVLAWWQIAFIVCDIIFGILLAGSIVMLIRVIRKK